MNLNEARGSIEVNVNMEVSKPNIHDASQGPDVRLAAMALLVEHLRGQVVGCPTDGLPPVPNRL